MGRIAFEFIVSDAEQIKQTIGIHIENTGLPYFRCFGMDLNSLISLYTKLKGERNHQNALKSFQVFKQSADRKETIIKTPRDYCAVLSTLNTEPESTIAEWIEKEGFSLSHWHQEYKQTFAVSLAVLASQALESNRSIFIKVVS